MLADSLHTAVSLGKLADGLHADHTFCRRVVAFMSEELVKWRGRQEVAQEHSELHLTSMLCAHLNSAARRSHGLDQLQFKNETPDVEQRSRAVDVAVAPCGCEMVIEGRVYQDFDTIMPIECKRLPTPSGGGRDEREYVFSEHSTTGGIDRFKKGHHGAQSEIAAMIGYVQEESPRHWQDQVARWISDLVTQGEAGWTEEDHLTLIAGEHRQDVTRFRSRHSRTGDRNDIELQHLWVQMN